MSDRFINKNPKSSKEQAWLFKNALEYSIELFKGGDEIWPDQCDYAISRLEVVKIILQDSCYLLDNNACPIRRVPGSQPGSEINVTLHYTYKQLSDLQTLVAAFQPVCRSAAKHIGKKRAEIRRKLESLMLNSESVIEDIASLEQRGTQRNIRYFPKTDTVIFSPPDEEAKHLRDAADKSDSPPDTKIPPPHLTLMKSDYVEKQDTPRLDQADKEHILALEDEQERKNILPLMASSTGCPLTSNHTRPCH